MEIRKAESKDITIIMEIMNEAIVNTTSNYYYEVRTAEYVERWFNQKQIENLPLLVYELDGKTIAFGTYGPFRTKDAYKFTVEHSIYVHNNYRGKGIGKQLLIALIEKAKSGGMHTIIGGIDAANEGSYQFHKKLGFVEVGRFKEVGYKFDRWLDLVFMQLILTNGNG